MKKTAGGAASSEDENSKSEAQLGGSKSLYHYTTAAGLIGIVSEQLLWATHANYLNDTAELKILSRLLEPQLSQEFRAAVPKLMEAKAFYPGMLTRAGESIYDTEAANACRAIVRSIENIAPIYVASFCMHEPGSEESRHGLLSQWRGYGRGGFAIEFDELKLDELTLLELERRANQMIATRKVEYENHAEASNLGRFRGLGLAALGTAFREKAPELAVRPDVAGILENHEMHTFIGAFMDVVPFLKTPRFKEENEYRLVVSALRPNVAKENGLLPFKVNFREGVDGSAIPYIKLFDGQDAKLPIRSIIVGPHREQDNQYNAVRLLLDQCELDVPVLRSDTTLRF